MAIGLVLHRLNGGLNNAVMAFALAAGPSAARSVPLESMLTAGLAGAERASRAANLLDALVRSSAPKVAAAEYLSDVLELLHEHASRNGCALTYATDMASIAKVSSTAAEAVRALVGALAALPAGADRLCVRFVQREDGPWFDLEVNGETCATGLSAPGPHQRPRPPS